jgi:hypothetical protein
MCTFTSSSAVLVCDVAIGATKAQLDAALGDGVRYTVVHARARGSRPIPVSTVTGSSSSYERG